MKRHPAFWLLLLLASAFAGAGIVSVPAAILSGSIGAHDPSRMILCDGKYYVYSTGGGMKFSADGVSWTNGPSPFAAGTPAAGGRPGRRVAPASVKALVPANQGIWAPDIIFYDHKYYLYYSVAAPLGIGKCVIGLLTSPTLDPSSPGYKWADAGVVIATADKAEKKSAIDPCPFVDAQGGLWLSWGSGYANGATWNDPTIIISKLDNATGLRSSTDTNYYPAAPGHIEASYVHYRAGYYYAFWNDGGCCSGTNSTYRIHVARSASPNGPYVNKAGKQNGNEVFMATVKEKEVYGPGQMGVASEPGIDRFSFHYYNAGGRPVLGVRTLVWGDDGWPLVGEDLSPGTYKITAGNGLALGVRDGSLAEGSLVELQPYTGSDFQKWIVAVTPEGYYRLTSVGSGKPFEVAVPSATAQIAPGAGNHQQWIIELTSDGKMYRLKSCATHDASGLAVTAAGAIEKSGVLTTAAWDNIPAQKWIFSAP